MAGLHVPSVVLLCFCCLAPEVAQSAALPEAEKAPVQTAPVRRLSGSDWTPTFFIYLKGPKEWQFRAFVGSSTGSVASIHLKDGTLDWKFVPTSPLGSVNLMYHKRGTVVMATDSGQVQAFRADGGAQLWDHECPSTVLHTILDVEGSSQGFALVCKAHVEYRTVDGIVNWHQPATNLKAAYTARGKEVICLLSLIHDHTVALKFNVEDGSVVGNATVPALVDTAIRSGDYVEAGEFLVFKDGTELRTYPICGGKVEALGLTVSSSAIINEVPDSPAWFGIYEAGGTKVVRLDPEGTVGLLVSESAGTVLGPAYGAVYGESGKFCTVARQESGSWGVHVKRPNGELYRVASEASAFAPATYGNVERVLGQQLVEGHFRSIMSTDAKLLIAVEGKRLLWARGTIDTSRAEL